MPICCFLYGVGIEFNISLPGLAGLPISNQVDVQVEISTRPFSSSEFFDLVGKEFYTSSTLMADGKPEFRVYRLRASDFICMSYTGGPDFVIDGPANRVWVYLGEGQTLDDIAICLLGPVMGVILRLRGTTCLHAGAVVIDGQAVAIVGVSGAGKSTTTAAFARLGYPVLTDDVLALVVQPDHFLVQPAYPRIRLWPEAAAGLFGSADALPRMMAGWDKRYLALDTPGNRFQAKALALGAVYFLNPRHPRHPHNSDLGPNNLVATNKVQPINSAQALMALISDSYASNFLGPVRRAQEFEVLSRLVEEVPLRNVTAIDDITQIDAFCNHIVNDFRTRQVQTLPRSSVHAVV